MKLWVGKEQEGIHRGWKTLFVGSYKITYKDIEKYINEFKVSQVYFGAGICSKINYQVVNLVLNKFRHTGLTITLEVDINQLSKIPKHILLDGIELIVSTTNKNYSLLKQISDYKVQIKVQSLIGDKVVALSDWKKFQKVNVDKLNGKTYKGDVVLID